MTDRMPTGHHQHWTRCHRPLSRAAALIAATFAADSALAASPSAEAALSLKPVQKDVDYDVVTADKVGQCEVRDIDHSDMVRLGSRCPDGSILRRFADTNGDKKIDLWCYFRQGVEVYRDVDEDFNGKADQYRWLGTNGIRWGIDENENGKIDRWQQISAEEVTAELIASLREADSTRFARSAGVAQRAKITRLR